MDEHALLEAILLRRPEGSRNRNFALFDSELGRRVRRRAGFLRSLAGELERARKNKGVIELTRGAFARGALRITVYDAGAAFVRSAYVTDEELALMRAAFPLAARVLDLEMDKSAGRRDPDDPG